MKKTWKRLCTGFLALATVVTALPTTPVHAESNTRTIRRAKTTPIWDCHPAFLSLMNMWRFLKCWGRKKA